MKDMNEVTHFLNSFWQYAGDEERPDELRGATWKPVLCFDDVPDGIRDDVEAFVCDQVQLKVRAIGEERMEIKPDVLYFDDNGAILMDTFWDMEKLISKYIEEVGDETGEVGYARVVEGIVWDGEMFRVA